MGKKKSKTGAKHIKELRKRALGVLSDLTVLANLASYSPAGSSPLSRLTLETDPAAVARREAQLKKWERLRREQRPAERKKLLDSSQRAEDARKKVLLHRSG